MIDVVADFGMVGDGAADDTAGFQALHAELRRSPQLREVVFPAGHYLTRYSALLANVPRVRLIGYGARLQHMTAGAGLIVSHEHFRNLTRFAPDITSADFELAVGARVRSAGDLTRSLTFYDGVVPAGFVPGAYVLLAGFIQQTANNQLPIEERVAFGWPPNFRWFEHHEVQSVTADGVVLREPLRFDYDEDWWDYPGTHAGQPYRAGAPRLYLLDRPNYTVPRFIQIEGFEFLRSAGSPTQVSGYPGFTAAQRLVLHDLVAKEDDVGLLGTYLQMNKLVEMRRCAFGWCEIDKVVERVLIEDTWFDGSLTSRGAGALDVQIRNVRAGAEVAINPRLNMELENVVTPSNVTVNTPHGGYYPTEPASVSLKAGRT